MTRALFWIASLVFFVVYAAQKYLAVPQDGFNLSYIISTGIVVLLTALVPFLVALFVSTRGTKPVNVVTGLAAPVLLSGVGFWAYWQFFILGFAPDVPLSQVLPRALMPGLIMGALLAFRALFVKD